MIGSRCYVSANTASGFGTIREVASCVHDDGEVTRFIYVEMDECPGFALPALAALVWPFGEDIDMARVAPGGMA